MEGRAQIIKDLEEKIERDRSGYVKQVAEMVNELSSSLPNLLQLPPIFKEKEAKEISNQFNQIKAELAGCLVVSGSYKPTYEQALHIKKLWESVKKTLAEEAAGNFKKFEETVKQAKGNEILGDDVHAILNAKFTKETDEKAKKLLAELKQNIVSRSGAPKSLTALVAKIQTMSDYVARRAVGAIIGEAIERSEKLSKVAMDLNYRTTADLQRIIDYKLYPNLKSAYDKEDIKYAKKILAMISPVSVLVAAENSKEGRITFHELHEIAKSKPNPQSDVDRENIEFAKEKVKIYNKSLPQHGREKLLVPVRYDIKNTDDLLLFPVQGRPNLGAFLQCKSNFLFLTEKYREAQEKMSEFKEEVNQLNKALQAAKNEEFARADEARRNVGANLNASGIARAVEERESRRAMDLANAIVEMEELLKEKSQTLASGIDAFIDADAYAFIDPAKFSSVGSFYMKIRAQFSEIENLLTQDLKKVLSDNYRSDLMNENKRGAHISSEDLYTSDRIVSLRSQYEVIDKKIESLSALFHYADSVSLRPNRVVDTGSAPLTPISTAATTVSHTPSSFTLLDGASRSSTPRSMSPINLPFQANVSPLSTNKAEDYNLGLTRASPLVGSTSQIASQLSPAMSLAGPSSISALHMQYAQEAISRLQSQAGFLPLESGKTSISQSAERESKVSAFNVHPPLPPLPGPPPIPPRKPSGFKGD